MLAYHWFKGRNKACFSSFSNCCFIIVEEHKTSVCLFLFLTLCVWILPYHQNDSQGIRQQGVLTHVTLSLIASSIFYLNSAVDMDGLIILIKAAHHYVVLLNSYCDLLPYAFLKNCRNLECHQLVFTNFVVLFC